MPQYGEVVNFLKAVDNFYFLALTSDKMYYSSQIKRTEFASKLRYHIFLHVSIVEICRVS